MPTLFYYGRNIHLSGFSMPTLSEIFHHSLGSLPSQPKRLVIAFSGGVDSRVLLELAQEYQVEFPNIECLAVHVHHGLSENADDWVKHCQSCCDEKKIPLVVERVSLDVESGSSIEKLARDARYNALKSHLRAQDVLLLGQHSDDQLETFLLALKRGSGPKGLSSMASNMPFGEAVALRPLLDASRADIEAFAHSSCLNWIEDESNQDQRFERNFLRHQVTPVLTKRWPSFRTSVQRTAQLCAEQELLLDELLESHLNQVVQPDRSLSIEAMSGHSPLLRLRLIRMWFSKLGCLMPSQKQLHAIWNEVACAQRDANPELVLTNGSIRRFEQRLYWVSQAQDISRWQSIIQLGETVDLPDGLGTLCLTPSGSSLSIALPKGVAQLDVIFDPEGLKAHPVGRGHSRKLKKLFQEYQVPSWLRRRTPILMHEDQVVCVVGLFVDRAFDGQDCEVIWSKHS